MTKKTRYNYGITFNGHHSTEFGLDVISKVIGMPSKNKLVEYIPNTNIRYDFSEIYGKQTYSEREITIVFKLNNWQYKDKGGLYIAWTEAINWLMGTSGFTRLVDDVMPNYYYLAEVEGSTTWEEFRYNGRIEVTFTAYPFRIDVLPEGHDIWDEFVFDLDVAQPVSFEVEGDWSSFKELNIGDQATYGAWATQYMHPTNTTGGGDRIDMQMLGQTYRITEKRTVDQSQSKRAYKLDGVNQWLLEQDVLQAQIKSTEDIIVNAGITEAIPTVTATGKITVIKNGDIFNLMPGVYSDHQFTFTPGDNELVMYSHKPSEISFEWHKELI